MILIIKGELTDLNTYINAQRTNRFVGAKIKKDETERVAWECKRQKLKKITCEIPEVFIDWYVKDAKKDADNITFAKKFILDGLVTSGVLPSDGRKFINAFSDIIYVDKKNPRIEITL
jgi:hypothetical protein